MPVVRSVPDMLRGDRVRRLAFVAATVAGSVCVLGAGATVVDPFHLTYSGELTLVAVGGLFVFLALTFALAPWPTAARISAAVCTVALGLVVVVLLAFLGAALTDTSSVVRSTKGDDGRELVVLWRYDLVDRIPQIRLRQGTGPFSQESLVYSGPSHGGGELPTNVRFSGDDRITFEVGDCTFASRYDPWTLKVHPVHEDRPGC